MSTVLAIAPYYLPYPGGAEKSMHEMLRRMVQLGFTAECLVPLGFPLEERSPLSSWPEAHSERSITERLDGVLVRRLKMTEWFGELDESADRADLIFFSLAHLFRRYFDTRVDRILNAHRQKVVYFCRGSGVNDYFPAAIVVANSRTVLGSLQERRGVRLLVLTPIISAPIMQPQLPRRFVTIINPSELKGGRLFLHLARKMPEVSFLAQLGRSAPVEGIGSLPNVVVRQSEADLGRLYAETEVLLVPSITEPFGRVALEGALGGCLLLLHQSFGLQEVPVPDFCFVDNLWPRVWEERLSRLLAMSASAKAEMRERIREVAATYDPGWESFVAELRLLMENGKSENQAGHEFSTTTEEGIRDGKKTNSIEELFDVYFPHKLLTDDLDHKRASWRCKLIVTGADTTPWVIDTDQGKSRIIRGDSPADATVTMSAADLMALVHKTTTLDFLSTFPGRVKIDGNVGVAARVFRLFQ